MEQVKAGLIPVSATVAVSIPKSYYRKVWQQQNPPAAGQEPELPDENTINQFAENINNEIRSHIAHVLPFVPDDGSKVEPISVLAFEKLTVPEPEGPPLTATAVSWLSKNWSTVGMLALGLFSFDHVKRNDSFITTTIRVQCSIHEGILRITRTRNYAPERDG